MTSLATWLRAQQRDRDLTNDQMAARCGLPLATFKALLQHPDRTPRAAVRQKLATGLEVPIREIEVLAGLTERRCALPECGQVFTPQLRPDEAYCSLAHAKRGQARERQGAETHPCECGCGLPVAAASRFRRGHSPGSKAAVARRKTPEHAAKLRENLLHGAARLGGMKTQLQALLELDPADAHTNSVLAQIEQLEAAGQDALRVVEEHGDQVQRDYMRRVVQPKAPAPDQQALNAGKQKRYGPDFAAVLAARAGHGNKGKPHTPAHRQKILPNLLTRADLSARHGGRYARKWLGRRKKPGTTRSASWRASMSAVHKGNAAQKAARYWEAQLRIRKGMTPTQLFALAQEFDPAITLSEFQGLAFKLPPVTTPAHLIARQLRKHRGRPLGHDGVVRKQEELIRARRAAGESLSQIRETTKLSRSTVYRVLRDK